MEENKTSKKKVIIIVAVLLLLIGLVILLLIRANPAERQKSAAIATIWMAESKGRNSGELDWENAPEFIVNERIGFLKGKADTAGSVTIRESLLSESGQTPDITSDLADMINNEDIVMVVGASEDLPTMYAAMETDFFGIPMLIPFSDGDLITDQSSGFILRMTPTSQTYTDFIGNYLLPPETMDWVNTVLFSGTSIPDDPISVAIFFGDNFNGHDQAVLITQRLMDNGFDIEHYTHVQQGNLYAAVDDIWKNGETPIDDIDVVLIIGYDQDPMSDLSRVVELWEDARDPGDQPLFLLMAYSPTADDPEIFTKNNVFVLRQKLDMSNCPADIVNHNEAIAYAAGWITGTAIERAGERQAPEDLGWKLWFRNEDEKRQVHQDYLDSFRTNIRSVLMEMNDNVPCYGVPTFTSANADHTSVELVRYTGVDQAEVLDTSAVFSYIYDMYRNRYGITD